MFCSTTNPQAPTTPAAPGARYLLVRSSCACYASLVCLHVNIKRFAQGNTESIPQHALREGAHTEEIKAEDTNP
jgi:hypothetical protein